MGSGLSLLSALASIVLPVKASSVIDQNQQKHTAVQIYSDDHTSQSVPFLVLFGSNNRPWNIEDWKEVSDTVRGGSSKAKIDYLDSSNRSAGVSFEGTLDTTTLGGAGFASQVYRHPVSITHGYSGFFIELEPLQDGSEHPIRKFTFGVKNTSASTQIDQGSSLIYQCDFEVPSRLPTEDSKLDEFVRIRIPFKTLVPTFRGRPKPDQVPFDPHHITEISLMCRSFFDQQSGTFQLSILRLGVE